MKHDFKHVLYIVGFIFLTKKKKPITSSCRLHSHQMLPGSKLQYLAIQAGITRVDILAFHSFCNSSMILTTEIGFDGEYVRT